MFASQLSEVLEEAQRLGFLGAAPASEAIAHALGFAELVDPPARFIDLGSGGGLPGLVLVERWPVAKGVLLDSNVRRCRFLERAVSELGLEDRLRVYEGRAEIAGRDPDFRSHFDVVVARSFGAPAVTAECAAPLLRRDGWLIVSEPPPAASHTGPSQRWQRDGLRVLGMDLGACWSTDYHYQALVQVDDCPDRYPRRVGVPAKRPLF